jgi:hypothetical protein
MRHLIISLLAVVASLITRADGLNPRLLPANTRWVLHLDGDAFLKTKIGAMIVDQKLEKFVEQAKRDLKTDLDFSYHKVVALTAFGANADAGADRDGVLIAKVNADVRGDLEKMIALKAAGRSPEPPISKTQIEGVEIYTIGGELNLTEVGEHLWLLSKSKTRLVVAREVVLGKEPSLKDSDLLKFPDVAKTFFFLAAADMRNAGGSAIPLPAQAQVLQKADGGRVVIGEKEDKLFINAALRCKDSETLTQLQQVIQGLVAFVALSKPDDKDLAALTSSASIAAAGGLLSINLSFPLDRAMQKVREHVDSERK